MANKFGSLLESGLGVATGGLVNVDLDGDGQTVGVNVGSLFQGIGKKKRKKRKAKKAKKKAQRQAAALAAAAQSANQSVTNSEFFNSNRGLSPQAEASMSSNILTDDMLGLGEMLGMDIEIPTIPMLAVVGMVTGVIPNPFGKRKPARRRRRPARRRMTRKRTYRRKARR